VTFDQFTAHFVGVQLNGRGAAIAHCPAHEDSSPSLSVTQGERGILVYCHAGCTTEAILAALNLRTSDLFFNSNTNGSRQPGRIAQTFGYRDEAGTVLFQVVRFEPKDFRQRRPDGNGGWVWSLKGVRRVPYRLPEMVRDFSQPVVFHEVEKAVEAALAAGLPGCHTTTVGGAKSPQKTDFSPVRGRHVVVVPDNDAPGEGYARDVTHLAMQAGAASVKILRLPNLPPKGDVVEWLQAGGTPEQFAALPDHTEPVEQAPDNAPARPELHCDQDDLDALTREAFRLVEQANHPPLIFRRGSVVVRIEDDDHGHARLVELTPERFRYHVANTIRFMKRPRGMLGGRGSPEDCKPPMDVVRNMLAMPGADMPLPGLRSIVTTPVLSREGRLVQVPGYDAHSQLLLRPFDRAVDLRVPVAPSSSQIAGARACLDEVLCDFPFTSDADRCHAVCLLLLPFVRSFIDGPTPLHLLEAPGPGSGKTLLVEALLSISVGGNVGTIADARDEDEMRKRITAMLLEGCRVMLLDNITRPFDSGVVSAGLTSTWWEDRRLGKTETVRVPVETVWVMTANNPTMSLEVTRRTVRCRLDPKLDRPWLRNGFRHANLRGWVERERPALVRAVLTLIAAWLEAGRPGPVTKPLGSFEEWSQVIGGIVTFAGYRDFLGNIQALYEVADSDGAVWRAFTTIWWEAHHDRPVSARDLFEIAKDLDGLYLGKSATERGQRTTLGAQLRKRRDQVIGPYRIEEAGISHNAALWRLRPVGAPSAPAPSEEEEELIRVD
jgi:hypothetical protein